MPKTESPFQVRKQCFRKDMRKHPWDSHINEPAIGCHSNPTQ